MLTISRYAEGGGNVMENWKKVLFALGLFIAIAVIAMMPANDAQANPTAISSWAQCQNSCMEHRSNTRATDHSQAFNIETRLYLNLSQITRAQRRFNNGTHTHSTHWVPIPSGSGSVSANGRAWR